MYFELATLIYLLIALFISVFFGVEPVASIFFPVLPIFIWIDKRKDRKKQKQAELRENIDIPIKRKPLPLFDDFCDDGK